MLLISFISKSRLPTIESYIHIDVFTSSMAEFMKEKPQQKKVSIDNENNTNKNHKNTKSQCSSK